MFYRDSCAVYYMVLQHKAQKAHRHKRVNAGVATCSMRCTPGRPPWRGAMRAQRDAPAAAAFSGAWLGAGTVNSRDRSYWQIMRSAFALCSQYPQLTVIVNHFDDPVPAHAPRGRHAMIPQFEKVGWSDHNRVGTTWIPGMKVLFWKLVLTPEYVRRFNAVWMFDSDVAVHPSIFPLGSLMGVLSDTGASLLQPSIRARMHGTYHTFLRVKHAHMSCMATTARFVELMIPIFRMEAWAAVHRRIFARLPDQDLFRSDHGIDLTWCALIASEIPDRPPCLVTPSLSALHTNTHLIERFLQNNSGAARSCSGVCKTLQREFKPFWANYSHDTKDCWGASIGGLSKAGTFEQDGLTVKARRYLKNRHASLQNPESGEVVRYLGLTSMHSLDNVMTTLLLGLKSTLNAVPDLRVFINFFDALKPGQSAPASPQADSRIFFSRVPGGVVRFWHTVITEGVLDGISALWIFDAGLSLHPSSLPLKSLLEARANLPAGVLQATVKGSEIDLISERQFEKVYAKRGGTCDATTIHAVSFNSVVIASPVWRIFMRLALLQPRDVGEQKLGHVACDAAARLGAEDNWRPKGPTKSTCACALLRAPAHRLLPALGPKYQKNLDKRPGLTRCFTRGCPGTFSVNNSLAHHDDGRCWSVSYSATGYSPHGYRSTQLSEMAHANAIRHKKFAEAEKLGRKQATSIPRGGFAGKRTTHFAG